MRLTWLDFACWLAISFLVGAVTQCDTERRVEERCGSDVEWRSMAAQSMFPDRADYPPAVMP